MHKNPIFNFDNSYLSLPDIFYSTIEPTISPKPELFKINHSLCNQLNLSFEDPNDLISALFSTTTNKNQKSFSQAYAGHQFGHFTKLGDGRAIILGEHLTKDNQRFDIQLKGSGQTPYSRRGDGKATLKTMLREYLISEAMFHLKIPSSRSLAVLRTGEPVYRDSMQEGAILVRVMKSHLRVGTFEYATYFGTPNDLLALANYTINRLYPEVREEENPILGLLNRVITEQINLVVNWMRVGFIHGVMNTDNTSISAETFDYGPCAFMNSFHPTTVYSSIDQNGRYAFGNQPNMIKWNLSRFAEALLPILHHDKEESIKIAQSAIDSFDEMWRNKYYGMMLNKIGISQNKPGFYYLVDELLSLMMKFKLDYTNTFWALSKGGEHDESEFMFDGFKSWRNSWEEHIHSLSGFPEAYKLMKENNPFVIPRNHLVEEAIEEGVNGNRVAFTNLLEILSAPYESKQDAEKYTTPPKDNFEREYQTFCGT